MSMETLNKCPGSVKRKFKKCNRKCTLADGDTLVTTGTVSMYIKNDSRRFDVNFSVFQTLSKPVILGTPFLKTKKQLSVMRITTVSLSSYRNQFMLCMILKCHLTVNTCAKVVSQKNDINTNGPGECVLLEILKSQVYWLHI